MIARVVDEEVQGRTRRKRKGKGAAAAAEEADKVGDGRAGPKSENVVLQKSAYLGEFPSRVVSLTLLLCLVL